MRAGRNPRRAYDEYGNGIPPATVWNKVARGYKTVMANARGCGHNAPVPLAGLPPDFPISDIALRLHCSECGARDIKIMLNVSELYDRSYGGRDYQGA